MYSKKEKIIFSMLTAYGLSINAGMDDDHSILTDIQSAAVQVVYREYLCSDEKQKVLDRIVEGIISILNAINNKYYFSTYINNYYVPRFNNDIQLFESFLESAKSKNHNEIHRILTENPNLNIGFFRSPELTKLVEKYRKHQRSLLDKDRTVLSQSARKTLYNNK